MLTSDELINTSLFVSKEEILKVHDLLNTKTTREFNPNLIKDYLEEKDKNSCVQLALEIYNACIKYYTHIKNLSESDKENLSLTQLVCKVAYFCNIHAPLKSIEVSEELMSELDKFLMEYFELCTQEV